jgi:hypothetical protein
LSANSVFGRRLVDQGLNVRHLLVGHHALGCAVGYQRGGEDISFNAC